jgi:hypothetical protein
MAGEKRQQARVDRRQGENDGDGTDGGSLGLDFGSERGSGGRGSL